MARATTVSTSAEMSVLTALRRYPRGRVRLPIFPPVETTALVTLDETGALLRLRAHLGVHEQLSMPPLVTLGTLRSPADKGGEVPVGDFASRQPKADDRADE